jgi:hypothetical protein
VYLRSLIEDDNYTLAGTSIQLTGPDLSRIHPGSSGSTGPDLDLDPLDRIWAEIRSGPSSVYSDLGLIPKDATARGWNIDYGLPDVFDDWCCAVSPRELDFTKFPIVGNGGLFRPSTIAPTPFSALRRRCMRSTDVVYDIPVTT